MKKNIILILSFVLLAFTACNSDDDEVVAVNAVAFASTSLNLTAASTPIEIKFAAPTAAAGTVTVSFVETAVVSGTDFSTLPVAAGKTIVVPFEKNVSSVSFTFNKLKEAIEGEVKNVVFTIVSATINTTIAANKTIQVNFNETASLGNALAPEVGGSAQPNQVYVDLSSGKLTTIVRTSWDLGFYSGSEFRVVLNGSLKMSAKKLTTTNIDEVQVEDESMIIVPGSTVNVDQVDNPEGKILETAIAGVSATDSENMVYLVNMGSNPVAAALGSEGAGAGTSRGWKKIRVLKSGNDYKIQYADIASTTHEEIVISKNSAYNFTFFSLLDKKTVSVEPQKNQWDLNFTSFTNVIPGGPSGPAPYLYADYVVNNVKGGAQTYQVLTSAFAYDAFTLANVDTSKFNDDQRNIGSNWRGTSVIGPSGIPVSQFVLRTDRFYVVKDPAGNIYKLKFTGGTKDDGERGFPKFQYAILK